jgi:hydrogenase-1 operon protein HyaE
MSHALIDRLVSDFGYTEVSMENHEEFVATPGMNVLFLPGDPKTVKDATDVAVVLPELMEAFRGKLNVGVVTDTFGDGVNLKRLYGFTHFPSLVFVRDGAYVGTVSRIRDWQEYLTLVSELLVAEPRRRPGIPVKVVSA